MSCRFKKGFTLIEMVVVVGIFLITTGIVLSNFKGFNRRSSLDLLAREMSLVIRQAQVYGSATKASPASTNRFPSYGVFLDQDDNGGFSIYTYKKLPADKYAKEEEVEKFNLTGGAVISGLEECSDENHCSPVNSLSVVFIRPNPGAKFFKPDGAEVSASLVKITIRDPLIANPSESDSREIAIWNTGHIYVASELGQ